MKKVFLGLILVVGVLAAVTVVMKRRSDGSMDEWRALADDTASNVKDATSKAVDEAMDSASKSNDDVAGETS